jgi:hypothetical protein
MKPLKKIEKNIPSFYEDFFFRPLRAKIDFARVILHTSRLLLLDHDFESDDCNSTLTLSIDKMNRLFFYKEDKFFSISYPFNITFLEGKIHGIKTYTGDVINNRNISGAISIIDNDQFKLSPFPTDFLLGSDSEKLMGLDILEKIFSFEPAYVRFDHDPKQANKSLHPLNHLDINYSTYGSFKVGTNTKISKGDFEDIFQQSTDCHFIDRKVSK